MNDNIKMKIKNKSRWRKEKTIKMKSKEVVWNMREVDKFWAKEKTVQNKRVNNPIIGNP